MRAVNLLPRDEPRRDRKPPSTLALAGVISVVAVTAVFSAWFLMASAGVTERERQFQDAQAELRALPQPPPTPAGADALEGERDGRIAALGTALSARVAWDRLLRDLALVLPDDVWLSSLQAKAPAAPNPATPAAAPTGGFTISGRTYSHDGVARLLARLQVLPQLAAVELQKSARAEFAGRRVVEFTIVAGVRAPGSSS